MFLFEEMSYNYFDVKSSHDAVIKWKQFPRYWPFVRGIHRSQVNSPHKGQWRGALMFSFICAWINSWVNNRKAGYLRRHRAYYDVTLIQRFYINFPYPDGVAIEWLWSVDGVYYFHRPGCTLQCHSDLMEWYWSGIGVECVANMQINTSKTLRSGIGVYFESGIGVVVTEWQWSVQSGVALECTFGVATECATGVALECVANMQINTALPLQSGNGVVRMEWQWSVHFIATSANFW